MGQNHVVLDSMYDQGAVRPQSQSLPEKGDYDSGQKPRLSGTPTLTSHRRTEIHGKIMQTFF